MASSNVPDIVVNWLVSQTSAWLKASARWNALYIAVTLLVSQASAWLKLGRRRRRLTT